MAPITVAVATALTSTTAPTSVGAATSTQAATPIARPRQAKGRRAEAPAQANGNQTNNRARSATRLAERPRRAQATRGEAWVHARQRSLAVVVAAPSAGARLDARRKWIAHAARQAVTRCLAQAAIAAALAGAVLPIAEVVALVLAAAAAVAVALVAEEEVEVAVAAAALVVAAAVAVAAVVARRWP